MEEKESSFAVLGPVKVTQKIWDEEDGASKKETAAK